MRKNSGLFSRSFSKREQKVLIAGAVITILLVVVSFCTAPHEPNGYEESENETRMNEIITSSGEETTTATTVNNDMLLSAADQVAVKQQETIQAAKCSYGGRSDYCDIQGDLRVDPKSATVYLVVPSKAYEGNKMSTAVKPYPRNGDEVAMAQIREWTIKTVPDETHQSLPLCSQVVHRSPALIFSLGAYFGNYFHAFTDVLVSLFVTAHPFNRKLHLLITNGHHLQVTKFTTVWQALSRYQVINVDVEQPDGKAHCFSRVMVGLKGRDDKELSINSSESQYTMTDFRRFLRSAYSLDKTTAIRRLNEEEEEGDGKKKKMTVVVQPRLLIVSRERTRTLTNVEEVARVARELEYEVTVTELDMNVTRSARVTNRVDVMVGVHGAALTNMVFLPENGVLIQVVPFAVDWFASTYFGEPSQNMNVSYLEYKIEREESSLAKQYPPDDVVFTNPASFRWEEFSPIYMLNQNITLNVTRFKPMLVKALELLRQ